MRISIFSLIAIVLGVLLNATLRPFAPVPPVERVPLPAPTVQYQSDVLAGSVVHRLLIPAGSAIVTVAVAENLKTIEAFAQETGAVAALNGGFFDPINQKSTSYVIRQGETVADPRQNDRLINNPDLANYLDQILDRSEFRRYQCGQTRQYAIVRHHQPVPANCRLVDALGAGSQLLPEVTLQQEGFLDVVNGQIVRDALGSRQANARSAIGIKPDGSILWVMVAQSDATGGMSLPDLAAYLKGWGVTSALNLDGGSSSALFYDGTAFHGKCYRSGDVVDRSVKSVLLVQP